MIKNVKNINKHYNNLNLFKLQEVGLREFGQLFYRKEIAKRIAQSSEADSVVIFDDVALAVPVDLRSKVHGLPAYERALLPGLFLATGFKKGATVLVSAPPSPVEIIYIHALREKIKKILKQTKLSYKILFEQRVNLLT